MKKIVIVLLVAGLAWFGYTKYQLVAGVQRKAAAQELAASPFKCDGRERCTQMTSCAEATFFIEHCPNTKMDGDHDGVPCEQQWCSD